MMVRIKEEKKKGVDGMSILEIAGTVHQKIEEGKISTSLVVR